MTKPKITVITYGADPEFFVQEKATGTIIPSCGLFGGAKGDPILLSEDGGYLEDGVTIEINVAPQSNVQVLRERILNLKSLWEQRFPMYRLLCQSEADFPKTELRKHRGAMQIGCDADLCTWGARRAPQISDFGATRYAGGHIHIGMDPWPEGLAPEFLIKWLDLFALFPSLDKSSEARFRHYGRPGLYRHTSYGVEWRSPDPTWVIGQNTIAQEAETAITALVKQGFKDLQRTVTRFESYAASEGINGILENPIQDTWFGYPGRIRRNAAEYMQWVLCA